MTGQGLVRHGDGASGADFAEFQSRQGLTKQLGRQDGVGIDEHEVDAVRAFHRGPGSGVAGAGNLVHGFKDDAVGAVLSGDRGGVVGGVVVDHDDFSPRGRGVRDGRARRFQGWGQVGFLVVGGDDDGEEGGHGRGYDGQGEVAANRDVRVGDLNRFGPDCVIVFFALNR